MSLRARVTRAALAAAAVVMLLLACAGSAAAHPGPKLRITQAQLARALTCTPKLGQAKRNPVLLTPAFSTDRESYGWNYLNALPALGRPTCSLSLPDKGFGDLQLAAEYDVRAIRRITERSGRKVVALGHQHGSLDALWALRFWPDIRGRVSELISLATPYNGTSGAASLCGGTGSCPPSIWQIAKGSSFLKALGRGPLPKGPSYTSIATNFDELITPQPEASRLRGASNVALQDICPGRPVEHFSILGDAVAYALVVDALRHRGPADPSRIPASVCAELFMPGLDATAASSAVGFLTRFLAENATGGVAHEPRLRGYAR